jgi:hypothetical protein
MIDDAKRFLCYWCEGEATEKHRVEPESYFTEERGYDQDNRYILARLEIGKGVNLSETAQSHFVMRVYDEEPPEESEEYCGDCKCTHPPAMTDYQPWCLDVREFDTKHDATFEAMLQARTHNSDMARLHDRFSQGHEIQPHEYTPDKWSVAFVTKNHGAFYLLNGGGMA